MSVKITKELVEQSIQENKDFISMVCKNKYGHDNIKDVIEGVIKYCDIIDEDQRILLRSGKFIPAGSILSACNTNKKCSFSNCYYLPIRGDSLEDIYDAHKQIARTYSYRGGVGTDITILRNKDSQVDNAAETSSGAVSFMPSFSNLTKTICQQGRRGALLISIDIRHPDVIDFINCKSFPDRVFEPDIFTNDYPKVDSANITIKITDSFMRAVEQDEDWIFCFPDIDDDKDKYNSQWDGDYDNWFKIGGKFKEFGSIKASTILKYISESAWVSGDPGLAFIDTIQRDTLGTYISDKLKPVGFNACSEQAMAKDNNCLLGCFVLPKYYINNVFDYDEFIFDIQAATRLMNVFSDINADKHPLQEQVDADKFGKRIGIEFTGFGDLCALMGFKYGDIDSEELISNITEVMLKESIEESICIAIDNGPCKAMDLISDRENFIETCTWNKGIINTYKDDIIDSGIANTAFLTVGPCGSISIVSDNCTSGIESLFLFSYQRKNRIDNKSYEFIHYPACLRMMENIEEYEGLTISEAKEKLGYVSADEVKFDDKINIIAAAQKNIDSSISNTLNMPNDASVDDIINVYTQAWEKGLKGVTVFRDGCKDGVLSAPVDTTPQQEDVCDTQQQPILYEKELLPVETAERHIAYWRGKKLYVSVSLDDDEPIEVFCKLPMEAGEDKDGIFNIGMWGERCSHWDVSSRLISLLLRYGIPLKEVLKQLDKSSYSMVDSAGILGRILRNYIKEDEVDKDGVAIGSKCPECGEMTYIVSGGCPICSDCGYTKCG